MSPIIQRPYMFFHSLMNLQLIQLPYTLYRTHIIPVVYINVMGNALDGIYNMRFKHALMHVSLHACNPQHLVTALGVRLCIAKPSFLAPSVWVHNACLV